MTIDRNALIAQWRELRLLADQHTDFLIDLLLRENRPSADELLEHRMRLIGLIREKLDDHERALRFMKGEKIAPKVHSAAAIVSGVGGM